jgi:hypothetical protein
MMDLQCEFIFPFAKSNPEAGASDPQHEPQQQAKELTVGEVFYAGCTAPQKITVEKLELKIDAKQKYSLKLLSTENQDNKWVFKFTSYQVGDHQFPKIELIAAGTSAETNKDQTVVTNTTGADEKAKEMNKNAEAQQPKTGVPSTATGNSTTNSTSTAATAAEVAKESESYNLGALNFKVNSILNPQEKVEPFGPFGGITISIPILYWIILVFAIVSILSSITGFFVVKWRRKKLLEKLNEYEISSTALQQFYTTYRKLQRDNAFFHSKTELSDDDKKMFSSVIQEMELALKLYLLRKFKTPALEKNWNYTLNDLNKYHHDFMSFQAEELKEIIKEIEKAKIAGINLKAKDIIQNFEKIRLFIEFSDNLQDALIRNDRAYIKKLRSLKV